MWGLWALCSLFGAPVPCNNNFVNGTGRGRGFNRSNNNNKRLVSDNSNVVDRQLLCVYCCLESNILSDSNVEGAQATKSVETRNYKLN